MQKKNGDERAREFSEVPTWAPGRVPLTEKIKIEKEQIQLF